MENEMREMNDLGFRPFFEEQIQDGDALVGRIAAEHRGGFVVWSSQGDGPARLAGRLSRTLQVESLPGVGDWVTLTSTPDPDGVALIDRVLTRQTVFLRGAAGRPSRGQVVAANVDVVFVVCGLDGDYNIRRIERYAARVWASGARPVVLLNKADLCETVEARVAEVEAACPGVDVLATSASRSEGLAPIAAVIGPGGTAAFVGSSGAGKSTLINRLLGEERLATREVRADDSRGRHTTTHRQLFVLPGGGLVIDTPGMRELQLFDDAGLDRVFSDVEACAERCRYRDCNHHGEPGCAVREAIDAGTLAEDRVAHYLALGAEGQASQLRRDTRKRREAERAFSKRISRDTKTIKRWKEGD